MGSKGNGITPGVSFGRVGVKIGGLFIRGCDVQNSGSFAAIVSANAVANWEANNWR
jgi:hypothetical protein